MENNHKFLPLLVPMQGDFAAPPMKTLFPYSLNLLTHFDY